MPNVTKRGRPPGSSRYSKTDPALLARIADRLVAQPTLSLRSTILQVSGDSDGTRLRRKFEVEREKLLAAARSRASRRAAQQEADSRPREPWSLRMALEQVGDIATLQQVVGRLPSTEYASGLLKQIRDMEALRSTLRQTGFEYLDQTRHLAEQLNNPLLNAAVRSELSVFSGSVGGMLRSLMEAREQQQRLFHQFGFVAEKRG